MPALHLVLPGDPETVSGGYLYDRRIVGGLQALGWSTTVHALDGEFPCPDARALDSARGVLAAIPSAALVVVDGLALGGIANLARAEAGRLRLVALVHHPLALETGHAAARAAALRRAETRALAAVRRVIVTSRSTARALASYRVRPAEIAVVEPGTDPAPRACGSRGGAVRLLCVGAVIPRKGHEVLVEGLAGMRELRWQMSCVGSLTRCAPAVRRLRERIARTGLSERITLEGELEPAALEARYAGADVFVLASLHEGYGMALAEALAHGLPVVSTSAGAIPDTVPEGAGILVPPGDAAALGRALRTVLADPGRRAELARGAAATVLPTWEQASARFAAALAAVAV